MTILSVVHISVTYELDVVHHCIQYDKIDKCAYLVRARAKRRTVQNSPRDRDCEKCCFFRTCAETKFSTISPRGWNSSYGYSITAKILTFSTWEKQHFSQSLPRGELWTVRRFALAHTVTEFQLLQFCCRCWSSTVTEICTTSNFMRKKQHFHNLYNSHSAHTVTEICTTSFVNSYWFVLKIPTFQLARVRKKQHFSQSLPHGELWTVRRLALARTVTEICTTSFVNFVILSCMLKVLKF